MKHDTIEQVTRAAPAVVGTFVSWTMQEISQVVAIGVGVVTIIYVLVQLAYLVRKWWVQEKGHRRARKSQFGQLGD